MSKDDLPSIDQFVNTDDLPSVEQFLTEDIKEELPSVEDYVEKEEQKIQEITEEFVPEEKSFQLNEVLRLINDVRESIPDIPEIKYYDKELEDICESIQILVSSIPEVKYYDADIETLKESIQEVRSQIPVFPKWVNEVNEVPDFSWIGKTFSVINDDFIKVNDTIETLRERIELDIQQIVEENEVKQFENKVHLETEIKDLDNKYQEAKDNIWKELRESSIKIWEYHKEFKDDDRKLKKQITNECNILKNNLEEKLKEFNENSVKTDQVLLNYFENLKEEVSNLPKVKYYDTHIDEVNNKLENFDDRLLSLNKLYDIVESIKSSQTELKEKLLTQQLSVDNEDPLTPLDQNFATLEDLSSHYRLFINRIQQQLDTIGGGGETRLEFLDDVDRDTAKINGYVLQYDSSVGKFIGTSYVSGSGGDSYWSETNAGIYTTGNVAIGTDVVSTGSTALWVQGDARITGILSVGTGTITLDPTENTIRVGTGITLDATNNIVSIGNAITLNSNTGVIEVEGSTIGSPTGDAFYTGIVTASSFVGDGSNLTGLSTTLIGLSDVNSSNLGDGRFLRYDASSSEFTFSPVSATNLELIAGDIQSGILTTSSTSQSVIVLLSASTYRSVNYQIQISEGSNYNMTTINVIHDGTNTYMTEYATINQPVGIATFSTDIDSGSLRLLGYPSSSNNTTFKVIYTAIEV